MKPVVFNIPGIDWPIPGYGLMLMLGLFAAIWWAGRRAERSGANPDVILNCGFIAIIAGVVGCRAMYVIHYWDQFRIYGDPVSIFIAIISINRGGLEFYGGFILTTITVLLWLRYVEKVSLRWYLDIIAPSAALGLAIGRVGCLLNGCCFGATCELPWAVEFPYGSSAMLQQWQAHTPGGGLPAELLYTDELTGIAMPLTREVFFASDEELDHMAEAHRELKTVEDRLTLTQDPVEKQRLTARKTALHDELDDDVPTYYPAIANMEKYRLTAAELREISHHHGSLPVHPTQFYSTITALLIAILLNAVYWRRTRDGQVMCTLLLIEPASRWMLEVIRADNPVDTVGVFTISQFLAVLMTLLGLAGLLALRLLPPRSPRAALWEPPEEEEKTSKRANKKDRTQAAR